MNPAPPVIKTCILVRHPFTILKIIASLETKQFFRIETMSSTPSNRPDVPAQWVKALYHLPLHDKLSLIRRHFTAMKGMLYYRRVFGSFGQRSVLYKPLILNWPQFVYLGDDVLIRPGVRIETIPMPGRSLPELRIGNHVNIEQNVHIICHSKVTIGDQVSITGNCAIVDVTHPYEDVRDHRKIGDRILDDEAFVEIGEGTFVGFGSIIMPNVRIGRYCIIGAHSVVMKDVPDYTVAAGSPARLLRRFDQQSNQWIRLE
jgi:acetyltransferase-like isoleucine patch superfamily enzyme